MDKSYDPNKTVLGDQALRWSPERFAVLFFISNSRFDLYRVHLKWELGVTVRHHSAHYTSSLLPTL